LPSSRWIADAAIRTLELHRPSLTLVYLPHLDYDFQRFGPDDPRSLRAVEEIDAVFGDLRAAAEKAGAEIVAVSEYGIRSVETPIDVNRALRRSGLLAARATPAGEVLDVFGSRAFAVADHQIAHVYARSRDALEHARAVVLAMPEVECLLEAEERRAAGLDHPRAGDLVAIARSNAWFTYYYWLEEGAEPDFARTVDIHRKPGYDPCELFLDPQLAMPQARVAWRLVQKKLGMRSLVDVIPTDARLVRGSHGRLPDDPRDGPVFLCSRPFGACGPEPLAGAVEMDSVKDRVLHLLQRTG
jgi:predicted AlkP superfamily pyrophosphatase or phosphodiesterase